MSTNVELFKREFELEFTSILREIFSNMTTECDRDYPRDKFVAEIFICETSEMTSARSYFKAVTASDKVKTMIRSILDNNFKGWSSSLEFSDKSVASDTNPEMISHYILIHYK